jgi:peptide deformylase
MILPVIAYGNPLLRKISEDIDPDYPGLKEILQNLEETMYQSDGVGLAAPQIGLNINLFIIDSGNIKSNQNGVKKFFLNAEILERSGKRVPYEEGCLSLPGIHEDVVREEKILIFYQDENFKEHEEYFEGVNARVIQHEYDHIIGKLFIDHLPPLKKRLLKKKLDAILNGTVDVSYKMKFYRPKKK